MKSVAILHYASPPTVGGVESTIAYHANGLAALGYPVKVVSGSGASFSEQVETIIDPFFGSTHPEILKVKGDLDQGQLGYAFEPLVERILDGLEISLADSDVCIVHNVLTLNKNLPLTAALARYVEAYPLRLIAWCHDLAWTNPQYLPELHDDYPWNLLRQPWKNVIYVTVSESRRPELADLLGIAPDDIAVVVPGVNPAEFFSWTPTTADLERRLGWLDSDGILLLPARLTRRKNIGLALRVLAELRRLSGRDFRLIITGPPGPHNPTNPGYLGELLDLRHELNMDDSAHFLYAYGDGDSPLIPDPSTMANLYQLADCLFFPSIQEGFGIPILEAGLAGISIFCSDIPPFHATGQDQVHYFDPLNDPPESIASRIIAALDGDARYRLRLRVRQSYRWETIIRQQLIPLLER